MQVNNNLVSEVESLNLNSAVKNSLAHLFDGLGVQGAKSQKVEGEVSHLTPETITEKFKTAHEDQIKTEKSTIKELTNKQTKLRKFQQFVMVTAVIGLVAAVALVWPLAGAFAALVTLHSLKIYVVGALLVMLSKDPSDKLAQHRKTLVALEEKIKTYEEDVAHIASYKNRALSENQFNSFNWDDEKKVHELKETLVALKSFVNNQERKVAIEEEIKDKEVAVQALETHNNASRLTQYSALANKTKRQIAALDQEQKALIEQNDKDADAIGEALSKLAELLS